MDVQPGRILIIDDDEYILLTLKLYLEEYYKEVLTFSDPDKALQTFNDQNYDVILLDMNFKQGAQSGEEGLAMIDEIKERDPDCNIITMTAYGDVDVAVEAIKKGAIDFIVKPWQNEKLIATVNAAYQLSRERKKVEKLRSTQSLLNSRSGPEDRIIGDSFAIRDIFRTIDKVAPTDAEILILGENGTGKEMIARAIHNRSDRASEAFITVDLGAIPETLFESELFGHKKGAFTDARENRIGRITAASGGTLFLDEIGNLSPPLQAKILTVLQKRKVIPVGSNNEIDVDIRVICATNQDLRKLVSEGNFREDLLYRINTVEINMPPLRDRQEDIPPLLEHFISYYARKYQKEPGKITKGAVKFLQHYNWPGNIRELQHAAERAVIMTDGSGLKAEDFSFLSDKETSVDQIDDYNLDKLESWAIRKAIRKHKGNISHAARELGLSRGAMYRRMEKYGI